MDDDELLNRIRDVKINVEEIENTLRLRQEGMQTVEALPSSSNIPERTRSDDDPNISEAPSGYRLKITIVTAGETGPDKKRIFYAKRKISIRVDMEDGHGNHVTTGNPASQAVEVVVLDSKKFRLKSDGYWTSQKFKDAKKEIETTNASFQLLKGHYLHEEFTIEKSSNKQPIQLGVIAVNQEGEKVEGIREGVTDPFFVEIYRNDKNKRSKKRMYESNPVLPTGSAGHHSTDEDCQPEDPIPMEEDSQFAKALEEQLSQEEDDPYKLGLKIWKALPSILDKFGAHSNTWRNMWILGNNLCAITDELLQLRRNTTMAPYQQGLNSTGAQGLNTMVKLRESINFLKDNISIITTDQELMLHQPEAKNHLQRALNGLLNLLLTKYQWMPTPTLRIREEQNENDNDKYLEPNMTTDVIPPRDEQTPGTGLSANPQTGANPTASAGYTDDSHGVSGSDIVAGFNCDEGHGSFLHDMLGYPSRNQHYNPYAAEETIIPITTDVEAVVVLGHEVVALAGPRPAYVDRTPRRRHLKTIIDDHALYACRRIGNYGAIGPFGWGHYLNKDQFSAMMGLQQTVDPFLTAIVDAALRDCLINSGRLFRTSHQQVQGNDKHPVAMMRKKEVVWPMSQEAPSPANKHKKIHVVEAEPSVGANKQQEGSCARCGSSKHHGESIDRQFVVLDLKATCLSSDEKKSFSGEFQPEIIEFSSVLVDAATGDVKSVFHTYVRPMKHQELGSFTQDYNGISQEDVEGEDAVMLSEALWAHTKWLVISQEYDVQGKHAVMLCKGLEEHIEWLEDNVCVVVTTWGAWDCSTMLRKQCQRNELHVPDYLSRWMNLKRPFMETYDIDIEGVTIDKLKVQDAVVIARLGWKGDTEKGGRSNVRNKARLLKLLILAGARLSITGWLDRTKQRGWEKKHRWILDRPTAECK